MRHLVTAREMARILQVCERTLWTQTRCGRVPVVRIGRQVRYHPETVIQKLTEKPLLYL